MNALASRVQKCIKDAQAARAKEVAILNPLPPFEELTHPWKLYWDAYRKGDFWSQMGGMPAWKSRPQTNIPFQVVETMTTLLTDSRPTAVPFSDSGHADDYYLAEWLRAAYLHWWNLNAGDLKVTLGVKYSRIFGLGWWRLDYEGEQTWESVHPDQVWVSPDTTLDSYLVREPTYLVYEYETQLGSLRKAFPKSGYKKRLDWSDFHPDWTISTDYERLRPIDDEERLNPTQMVKVYQFWTLDPEQVEWKEEVDDQTVTKTKPKYPGGRVVTLAGGMVLDDRPNPYKHRQYPFTPVFAYIAPGQFYPIGDVQNIWPLVIQRNRMNQLLFDGTVKAGGGKIYLGQGSGLEPKDITNNPLEVVPCRDVNQIRHEQPPAPSRHIFDFIATIDRDVDNTAGLHDISRGARTQGNPVTAQEAMMLGESDRTRIRLASRLLTWSLNRLGRQWCYNAAQFDANTEFIVNVVRDPREQVDRPGFEDSPMVPVEFTPADLLKGDSIEEGLRYGMKFTEFSSLPNSINEDRMMAFQLYQGGLLDEEDLLLAIDWPNARYVAQKAKARMASQAPPSDAVPPETAPEAGGMPPPGMPQMPMMPEQAQAMMPPEMPPQAEASFVPPEIADAVSELVSQGMPEDQAVEAVMAALEQMGVA